MRLIANFAIIGAAWAISVKAQSDNCRGTALGLLDRGFAAFKGSEPNFHDFTPESGEALPALLQEVSASDLIKCIDECVGYWPPVDQIDAPLEDQYKQSYCRAVKWIHMSTKCILYKVAPADIRMYTGPDIFPIIGGAVIGECAGAEAQRLIATDQEQIPSCCDVRYRFIGVEV